jgi:hypothetical protein
VRRAFFREEAVCEPNFSRNTSLDRDDEMRNETYGRKMMTSAEREANKIFKQPAAQKAITEDERARKAFQDNRERLKAERLAREKDRERSLT